MDRRSFIGLLPVGAALLAAGCGSSTPVEPQETGQPPEYRLGPGDNLRVIVFGEDQLSGEFAVDGSGSISMPLIGAMKAQGRTPRQLEQDIAQRLSEGYVKDARVSVQVLNFRPFYIIGEVNKPGQYPYSDGMTAITAVAVAGGYTYRANEEYVLVTRGGDPSKTERRAPVNTHVYPEDVVRVPERFF
jgi:polysaccharide export outer membrane protein